MGYYLATKGNKVLIGATTWMKVKSITQREKSQAREDNYCMIPLNGLATTGKSIDWWLPRGWGG